MGIGDGQRSMLRRPTNFVGVYAMHERLDGPITVPVLDVLVAHETGITGCRARTLPQNDRHTVNGGDAGKAER